MAKGRKGDTTFKHLCTISSHLTNEEPPPILGVAWKSIAFEARGEILYGRAGQHLSVKNF